MNDRVGLRTQKLIHQCRLFIPWLCVQVYRWLGPSAPCCDERNADGKTLQQMNHHHKDHLRGDLSYSSHLPTAVTVIFLSVFVYTKHDCNEIGNDNEQRLHIDSSGCQFMSHWPELYILLCHLQINDNLILQLWP